MKVLAVHPSGSMYTRVFLRLEPLGPETVAAVIREAGHDVRLIDLQVESHRPLHKLMRIWRPDAVCFSANDCRSRSRRNGRLASCSSVGIARRLRLPTY